jgi:hypothetical protein
MDQIYQDIGRSVVRKALWTLLVLLLPYCLRLDRGEVWV